MAKMTKAQREAEDAKAAEIRWAELTAAYLPTLFLLMETAVNKFHWTLTATAEQEMVLISNDDDRHWKFPLVLTDMTVQYRLQNLEDEMGHLKAMEEEATRKRQLKAVALAKLTDEERIALGL